MATRERLVDRGRARGRHLIADAGRGLRDGRRDRGLSLAEVGRAIGLSRSQVSRIERGLIAGVTVAELAVLHAAVGLDLTLRAYPGGQPLRDAAHAALLSDLRAELHRSLRWAVEVPLPAPGDQRSWDAMIIGRRPSSAADVVIWRRSVEAEMVPRDGQALIRRIQLKRRDGGVDGVLLLLRPTLQSRLFVREAADMLRTAFPFPGSRALELLRAGVEPEGDSVIILPARKRARESAQRDARLQPRPRLVAPDAT